MTDQLRELFIAEAIKLGMNTEDRDIDYHTDEFESEVTDQAWRVFKAASTELALSYMATIGQLQNHLESLPKIKADAIREAKAATIRPVTVSDLDGKVLYVVHDSFCHADKLDAYADQLEGK